MSDKNKPEREKGAAPADYMPAIFGWLNMEEQAEQAREISYISKKAAQKSGNIVDYKFSNLSDDNLTKIKELEDEVNHNEDKDIYLIAFNKK